MGCCASHSKQAGKAFFVRQRRGEFRFDNRHTLAKFVEFVAARFAETKSHDLGVR
jgi:hypothetical protein